MCLISSCLTYQNQALFILQYAHRSRRGVVDKPPYTQGPEFEPRLFKYVGRDTKPWPHLHMTSCFVGRFTNSLSHKMLFVVFCYYL